MPDIRRVATFNGSAPGADTDILASALTPKQGATRARITCAFSHTTKLNLMISDGSTTIAMGLNDNSTLATDAIHTFDFAVDASLAYNLQLSHDGVIDQLIWDDWIVNQ